MTYEANSTTATGTAPTDSNSYTSGATVTVATGDGTLVNTGYTFGGWSLTTTGAAITSFTITGNTTLYAVWTATTITTYTVTYDANSTTATGTAPTDSNSYTSGATVTVATGDGTLVNTGYTFGGWSLTTTGAAITSFTITGNTTLYAVWTATTTTTLTTGGSQLLLTVQTSNATNPTTNSATLDGSIATNIGGTVDSYGFYWGTGASPTTQVQVGTDNHTGPFTYALTGLTPGTTYSFEAYASNSQGLTTGTVLTFTTVVPAPPPIKGPVFTDVPSTFWAYADIENLVGLGYATGYSDGTFRPNNQITRAEFCAIMDKVLNVTTFTPQTPTFTDVNTGDWFYQAVEEAVYAGIAKGYNDGTFRPNSPISRQEIACVLVQALGKSQLANSNANAATTFGDDNGIAWWSRGYIYVALQQSIVSGYTDNSFDPGRDATRAEACAMISNFLKVYSGK